MKQNRIFSKKNHNRIENKIKYLGLKIDQNIFNGLRVSTTILLFLLLIFLRYGYILAPLLSFIYFMIFEYIILDLSINLRRNKLEQDAIEFFPIFLLSLNNGRNIKKAISTTVDLIDNSLSKEFYKVLQDIKIGKTLDESLLQLVKRIPSELINNMIYSIIEANKAGNSLNNTINNQLSYIIDRNKKRIIRKNKLIPAKMLIQCIIFTTLIIIIMIVYKIII